MLLIDCPWCGARDVREFKSGGEGHIRRQSATTAPDETGFADYLFMRSNPKGPHAERWVHAHGCRRWFNMLRRTDNDRILAVYKVGEPRPAPAEAAAADAGPAATAGPAG